MWAFNEEVVARAIARSRLPVISAVGHEIDFTISDFVADLRAPTPSAAAELVVRPRADLEEQLRGLDRRLNQMLERQALHFRNRLIRAAHSYVFREPGHLLRQHRQSIQHARLRLVSALRGEYVERQQRVDEAQGAMLAVVKTGVREKSLQLERLAAQLRALGPQAVLERGYSITRTTEGRVVTKANEVKAGQELEILLAVGSIKSTVKNE